jgi:hypothetical protein
MVLAHQARGFLTFHTSNFKLSSILLNPNLNIKHVRFTSLQAIEDRQC